MVLAARQRFGLLLEDVAAPAAAHAFPPLPIANSPLARAPGIGGLAKVKISSVMDQGSNGEIELLGGI
eukprot:13694833-Heterocapsa_arctica.AAC.1